MVHLVFLVDWEGLKSLHEHLRSYHARHNWHCRGEWGVVPALEKLWPSKCENVTVECECIAEDQKSFGNEDRDILPFMGIRITVGDCNIGAGLPREDSGKLELQNCGFDYHAKEFKVHFGALTTEGLWTGLWQQVCVLTLLCSRHSYMVGITWVGVTWVRCSGLSREDRNVEIQIRWYKQGDGNENVKRRIEVCV